MTKKGKVFDTAAEDYSKGLAIISDHPMFSPLYNHARITRVASDNNLCPKNGWAIVNSEGHIFINKNRRATPEQWSYIIAHCLLHLGFEHLFAHKSNEVAWNAACDYFIGRFLAVIKLGRPVEELTMMPTDLPGSTEEQLYQYFCERGVPPWALSLNGKNGDMIITPDASYFVNRQFLFKGPKKRWSDLLGEGLSAAIESAVRVAAGYEESLGAKKEILTPAKQAYRWFINSYPMLGGLAASFTLIEDTLLCHRMNISIAAVSVSAREIYINPSSGMCKEEWIFILAHELLHVGLRHDARINGRDPYLWNVACDYVINGWLNEMSVGVMPAVGVLYDPKLKGMSGEAIYDMLATDLRRSRKLATLRGFGLGDIIGSASGIFLSEGISLDEFCRQSLSQGLTYHLDHNRGFLPGNLVEEIRSLAQAPIPWDVELASWFQQHFPALLKRCTYSRASRRQSSTPDIARPQWYLPKELSEARTFGVVLDTSGSMSREMLGLALGAIASYSIAHDVYAVRVVFCDAFAYDQGYMDPRVIADSVQVRGRGGTVIQPGIDLLENAKDFPKDGPILLITDGYCEILRIKRSHAFLLPEGHHLPFIPTGEVFRMKRP